MQIPLFVILIIYGAGLVIWIILTLFTLYQVLRYGTFSKVPLVTMCVYLVFCFAVIGLTWLSVRTVDWHSTVDLSAPSISIPTNFNIPSLLPK